MQACTVVIPTYNERENIEAIVARVLALGPAARVLIVDDASPDGTGDLADALAASDERVRVLHRTAKNGLGPAYIEAFQMLLAEGVERIAELDADGSFAPEDLPALVDAVANGADLAIGARWIPGGGVRNWPLHRRLISRGGSAYARLAVRSRLHDLTSGFRVFSAEALRRVDLSTVSTHGYGFQVEMAWRLERSGAVIRELPVIFVEREHGASKMTTGIVLEAFAQVTRWGLSSLFGARVMPASAAVRPAATTPGPASGPAAGPAAPPPAAPPRTAPPRTTGPRQAAEPRDNSRS